MSDRSFRSPPHDDDGPEGDYEAFQQEAIVSEKDVASAGRSCVALLAMFLVLIVLFAIWFLYRSTT